MTLVRPYEVLIRQTKAAALISLTLIVSQTRQKGKVFVGSVGRMEGALHAHRYSFVPRVFCHPEAIPKDLARARGSASSTKEAFCSRARSFTFVQDDKWASRARESACNLNHTAAESDQSVARKR